MRELKNKRRKVLNMKILEFHSSKKAWVEKPRSSWNIVTFVSYFCIKYENLYGTVYRFSSWKGNPALTKEGRDFSKILKSFSEEGLSNEESKRKLYNYINWSFDFKGSRGVQINSTGLLANHTFRNQFEKMYSSYQNKAKSKTGIETLIEWCKSDNEYIIQNYDLKDQKDIIFISKMVEEYGMLDSPEKQLVEKAKSLGLL